ncbi:hypothetical protein L484_021314 [Morus notabilis]|uniref:Uncharacterized protein n=1 Tax=Morus notabilis TaxID=981085 RepID=W9SWJ1_9ROSA|nr:hypothetical protein L484_021314 [Morus notabilis]
MHNTITICPNAILLHSKGVDSGNATTKALSATATAATSHVTLAGPITHRLSIYMGGIGSWLVL